MIGLILATCVTVSAHCGDAGAVKWDIVDAFPKMSGCKAAFDKEPKWRQALLICDEITPVDEHGVDIK